jgi:hypothetical protein
LGDAPLSTRDEWDDRFIKHWRHDWTYQDTSMIVYAGHQIWRHQTLSPEQAHGTWTQAVYQVNDLLRLDDIGTTARIYIGTVLIASARNTEPTGKMMAPHCPWCSLCEHAG